LTTDDDDDDDDDEPTIDRLRSEPDLAGILESHLASLVSVKRPTWRRWSAAQ
jgi:hypothetical protein